MTNFRRAKPPGEAQRLRWQKALVDSPVLDSRGCARRWAAAGEAACSELAALRAPIPSHP